MNEVWRPVLNFEDRYEVSNKGSVRTKVREYEVTFWNRYQVIKQTRKTSQKRLKPRDNGRGYMSVNLIKDGKQNTKYIHRLMAEAFIPNPENKDQINHKNGIKGDNRIDNLEWCTSFENQQHALNTGLRKRGENSSISKLTRKDVLEIRAVWPLGWFSQKEISKAYGVSVGCINCVVNRYNWKHL